jgi:MFS family permease
MSGFDSDVAESGSATLAAEGGHWRRNQVAVTAAAFIGYTGFTLVMPFLPLYIAQLGVRDVGQVALWSGLSLGATPALTALLSPAWGRVADRFGRKLMLERALASFVVVMAMMALVRHPWQVFALRLAQGLFAGYGGLTLAMAAESAPRDRMASAIGLVQTAQRLGPAIGPVIGGLVAALVGLRRGFLVTASFYLVALVLVAVMYREPPARHGEDEAKSASLGFRAVLGFPNFLLMLVVIFGIQYVDRSLGPILPLYVAELGVPAGRAAVLAGILFSVVACSAAAGHHVCGRAIRRVPAKAIVIGGGAAASAAIAAFALASAPWTLALTIGLFGLAVGAAMTAAYAAAGSVIPPGAHGTAFGLLTGASLTGLALSPVLSGLIAGISIRLVFVLDVAIGVLVVAAVARWMVRGPAGVLPAAAAAPEASGVEP